MNPNDELGERVGVVDGAEEATTQRFRVVLDAGNVVQLDDILVCRQQLADGRQVDHFGIVLELGRGLEGASYASDTERIANRTTPGLRYRVATVQMLRTVPEVWVPPDPSSEVYRARGAARDLALFRDQMAGTDLNIGLDGTGAPVPIDFRFFNGEQGGHASVSGISGVATKTSFAMHLLYMMLESRRGQALLGEHLAGTRCIIFNVKGEDLLHLDRANARYGESPETAEQWRALGVDAPAPFRSVAYFVPPVGTEGLRTTVTSRGVNAYTTFGITPETFVQRGLISYVFNEPPESHLTFVVENIRMRLAQHCEPLADGGVVIKANSLRAADFDRASADFARAMHGRIEPGDHVFRSFRDLVAFITSPAGQAWDAGVHPGTWDAFVRRLYAMSRRLGHLVRNDADALAFTEHLNVIDINRLHFDAQRFVVGTVLDEIWQEKQEAGRLPLRFVVLDELNKYAPREGRSPIKEMLVDISSRGRSLGVILVGCQQVASAVEPAVTDNASINVVGRLKAQHAREYRFLSPELQDRTIRLRPGMMVLEQPTLPAAIPITFPLAPFATNRGDDPLGAAADAAAVRPDDGGDPLADLI